MILWSGLNHNIPCYCMSKKDKRNSYITVFCPPPNQATKWAASHNQLWPFPIPQRSHDNQPHPLQSERDCPSEPNCSGRSQTRHSASQPGWVQSELTTQLYAVAELCSLGRSHFPSWEVILLTLVCSWSFSLNVETTRTLPVRWVVFFCSERFKQHTNTVAGLY